MRRCRTWSCRRLWGHRSRRVFLQVGHTEHSGAGATQADVRLACRMLELRHLGQQIMIVQDVQRLAEARVYRELARHLPRAQLLDSQPGLVFPGSTAGEQSAAKTAYQTRCRGSLD